MIKPILLMLCHLMLLVAATNRTLSTNNDSVRGVAFLKLHKVGSSTVTNAIIAYATDHNLRVCPRTSDTKQIKDCDVEASHEASEFVIYHKGLDFYMKNVARGLGAPVTVVVLRDPLERVLSRFFYNHEKRKKALISWPKELRKWLKNEKWKKEGTHYVKALGQEYADDAIKALQRFDVVGLTENLESALARVALHTNTDAADWSFHSQKVVVGRPTYDDLEPRSRYLLKKLTLEDRKVYKAAQQVVIEQENRQSGFTNALATLMKAQKGMDDCEFRVTGDEKLRAQAEGANKLHDQAEGDDIDQKRQDCYHFGQDS